MTFPHNYMNTLDETFRVKDPHTNFDCPFLSYPTIYNVQCILGDSTLFHFISFHIILFSYMQNDCSSHMPCFLIHHIPLYTGFNTSCCIQPKIVSRPPSICQIYFGYLHFQLLNQPAHKSFKRVHGIRRLNFRLPSWVHSFNTLSLGSLVHTNAEN